MKDDPRLMSVDGDNPVLAEIDRLRLAVAHPPDDRPFDEYVWSRVVDFTARIAGVLQAQDELSKAIEKMPLFKENL